MRKALSLLFFLTMTSALLAEIPATTIPLEQVLSQMKLREQTIQTIQFGFEQEVTFLNSSLASKTSGQALFQKPDKLSVHLMKPKEQVTIANGKKTWVYTPSYKQVWVGHAKKDFSTLLPKGMVPINNLGEDLEKNYTLSILPSKSTTTVEGSIHLLALPKQSSDYRLEFVVSTESWLPTETVYLTSSAKVTTRLSTIKVNPEIVGQPFQFIPPPGTDVIPF